MFAPCKINNWRYHVFRLSLALNPVSLQTEIVDRLLEILSQDTEGFSRRAVIRYFITWFSSHSAHLSSTSLLMRCVPTVLSQGSADLDWEVKVYTLELAELLLDKAFSSLPSYRKRSGPHHGLSHPYGAVSDQKYMLYTPTEGGEPQLVAALNNLVEQGVIAVLLSGLVDCDRPVALKACRLLITLRETAFPLSQGALDAARVSCELPDWGWGQEIRKTVGMKMNTGDSEAASADDPEDCGLQKEGANETGDGETVGVCEVLRSLHLDEKLDILSQSSDHIHNSPLSLLQDILTASTAHTHPATQPGQEVIVDCY